MRQVWRVGLDLLLEAIRRRWFLALFAFVTLALVLVGQALQVQVVDGAIAGSTLFGEVLFDDIFLADRVLGPVYLATAYLGFFVGIPVLAVACCDFAPELMAPGRIEHLLSLPVARWQVVAGTYLGVVTLAAATTLYASAGLTVLLGLKTGLWNGRLVLASMVGWVGFCALYAPMLAAAIVVRSAALSAATGFVTLVFGVMSSVREQIIPSLEPGLGRFVFRWAVMPFPRLGTLARASAHLASGQTVPADHLGRLVGGALIFSAALLALSAYQFERKDF